MLSLVIGLGYYVRNQSWAQTLFVLAQNQIHNLTNGQGSHSNSANPTEPQAAVAFKLAILSDTHEDTTYFPGIAQAIAQRHDLDFVAHLGDLSNAGDKTKLQQAKQVLDSIPETVYVLPGDHDLNWYPNHDLTNFKQVFGETRTSYSFNHGAAHFVFIDNSDLNNGISSTTWAWLTKDLQNHNQQPTYAFMSTPISNPYLGFKAMGSQNQAVKDQAGQLGQLLKNNGVRAVFAGDTHTFSQYKDADTGLPIITVGSAGSTKNPLPLYVVVEILKDGGYNVASIPFTSPIPVKGDD